MRILVCAKQVLDPDAVNIADMYPVSLFEKPLGRAPTDSRSGARYQYNVVCR